MVNISNNKILTTEKADHPLFPITSPPTKKIADSKKIASVALPIFLFLLTLTACTAIGIVAGTVSIGLGLAVLPIVAISAGAAAGAVIGSLAGSGLATALHFTMIAIFKRQVKKETLDHASESSKNSQPIPANKLHENSQAILPSKPPENFHPEQAAKLAENLHSKQPARAVETHHPKQPARPAENHHSKQAPKPVETHHPKRPTRPAENHHSKQALKPVETHHPERPARSAENHHSKQALKPVETHHPKRPVRLVETHHPKQSAKPVETHHPKRPVRLVETHHPKQSAKPAENLHLKHAARPAKSHRDRRNARLHPLSVAPGIPNMQRGIYNICWMNSVVKLMANTHYYDQMLQKDVHSLKRISPEQKAHLLELQVALNAMITAIRNGKPGTVIDESYPRNVIQALQKISPKDRYGIDQLDSAEFHRSLQAWFDFPSIDRKNERLFPQLMTVYQSEDKFAAKNVKFQRCGVLPITIPMYDLYLNEPIDITCKYMGISNVTVHEDISLNHSDDEYDNYDYDPQGSSFIQAKILVNAPDELFININRNTLDIFGDEVKCQRPLSLDKGLTATFLNFKKDIHISDENKTYLEANTQVVYEVKGGSIHIGRGAKSGHYIYVEKMSDGRFICHSDSKVTTISAANAEQLLKQASILHFRKVQETPVAEGRKFIALEQLTFEENNNYTNG